MDSLCDKKLQTVKWDQWFFSRILFIILFLAVQVLHGLFPSFGEWGLPLGCGSDVTAVDSLLQSAGLGSRGPWAPSCSSCPRAQAQWLRMGLAACHVGSSQFRDGSLLLHRQADSFPLRHQGSLRSVISEQDLWSFSCLSGSRDVPSPCWELQLAARALPTLISTRATLFPPIHLFIDSILFKTQYMLK